MEFTIGRDEFFKNLQRAQGVVSTKGAMPILANILIDASDSQITLFATNLDMGLRGTFDAKVSATGKTTVQAKKLFDIVRELPSEDITIKTDDDGRLRVTCGKTKFNLATIGADEFPKFPEFDETRLIGLESDMLLEMIRKTSYAISQDETRLTLNGALLEVSPTKALMVATDGHRLAYIEREGAFKVTDTIKCIIARKAIHEIQKLIGEDGGGPAQFTQQDNHVFFKKGKLVMVVRLIEGAYPNYEQVIPKTTSHEANAPIAELISSLKRVATMADDKSHMVSMSFEKGKLELSSEGGELGEAKDEIPVEYTGDGLVIGLNANYMIDVLNILGGDKAILKTQDQLSPMMAQSQDDPGLLCIVMPMRI